MMLFAQVALDSSLLSLAGNGITVAVLAWYVVYDVRVRMPAMLLAFATEQAATRATFSAEQTEVHKHYSEVIDRLRETFSSESSLVRDRYDRETAELRKMLFENMTAMRTAVHDVKDTAQVLMNKQSISEVEIVNAKDKPVPTIDQR